MDGCTRWIRSRGSRAAGEFTLFADPDIVNMDSSPCRNDRRPDIAQGSGIHCSVSYNAELLITASGHIDKRFKVRAIGPAFARRGIKLKLQGKRSNCCCTIGRFRKHDHLNSIGVGRNVDFLAGFGPAAAVVRRQTDLALG